VMRVDACILTWVFLRFGDCLEILNLSRCLTLRIGTDSNEGEAGYKKERFNGQIFRSEGQVLSKAWLRRGVGLGSEGI
jgi:hypothetical protein